MMHYNVNTPILLLLSNKPDASYSVFSHIRKMKPGKLYFAADGPRYAEEEKFLAKAKDIVNTVDWECDVMTLFKETYLGYNQIMSQAVSWFFEHEQEGIILEDDCMPADCFFGFCSRMLEKFRFDERIGHVTGSNFQQGIVRGDGSYYFSMLPCVWGWAGWRRVWKDFDLQLDPLLLDEKMNRILQMKTFAHLRDYWYQKLLPHFHWSFPAWWLQYAYLQLTNNRLSVIPNKNIITHIEHTNKPMRFVMHRTLSNIPISEMDDIIHPSFVIADTDADIHSRNLELNMLPSKFYEKEFLFVKDKLIDIVSKKNKTLKIPKIIHQLYINSEGVPDYLTVFSHSWKEKHPEWEYRFWNEKDVERLLDTDFKDVRPIYLAFPYDVQRWDFIRYLILYRFGGLYADMDYECFEPLDALLWDSSCCFGMEPAAHALRCNKSFIIGNALMASVPEHDFFSRIITDILSGKGGGHRHKGTLLMETTGPFMIHRVYNAYEKKDDIALLPAELVAPLSLEEHRKRKTGVETTEIEEKVKKAFAIHYFSGSWCSQVT